MDALEARATADDKPVVQLSGENGNAFFIIGRCMRIAKQSGWSDDEISALQYEMRAGNYDHLLQTAMKYFDVK